MKRAWLPFGLALTLISGCSSFESEPEGTALPSDMGQRADGKPATAWPSSLSEAELKQRIVQLLPGHARDKAAWASDLYTAYKTLDLPHATQTYCAAIAVIEQESSFQADPVVRACPISSAASLKRGQGALPSPDLSSRQRCKKTGRMAVATMTASIH